SLTSEYSMPLALYLLALAVFVMGTSEFMLAGLLPAIATDLDITVGAAGLLTSAFAVGMVVGAPLMAAFARRWPPRLTLLACLGAGPVPPGGGGGPAAVGLRGRLGPRRTAPGGVRPPMAASSDPAGVPRRVRGEPPRGGHHPVLPGTLATRVISALANAGFLAVGLSAATTLVPVNQKGRALAILLSG